MSSTPNPNGAAEVFYSYSHEDESLRIQLEKHLRGLKHGGQITEWHDRQIEARMEWEGEIHARLESAHLILLLISADFIASEYCYSVEMRRALERHEAGEACVIPIILRPLDWTNLPFSKLQALPAGGKAVTSWKNRDEAFANIATGIRQAIEVILPGLRAGSRTRVTSRANRPKIGGLLPYLCDRSEQELELDRALQFRKKHFERRPFVCIIHGDEYECHDMFRTRIKDVSLPRLLNLGPESGSIEEIGLQWPPAGVTVLDEALQVFHRNLAGEVVNNRDASSEEILGILSHYTAPILIYSHLVVENWAVTRSELRDVFIRFWNGFPDLPPGRVIIACLLLTYKRTEQLGILDRWRHNKLNKCARTFLAGLNFAAYGNLHGAVLPELRGVQQQDVENWIREGKNFCGLCQIHDRGFCNVQGSVEAIRSLYRRSEYLAFEGQIPMQLLVKDLTKLIEDYRC